MTENEGNIIIPKGGGLASNESLKRQAGEASTQVLWPEKTKKPETGISKEAGVVLGVLALEGLEEVLETPVAKTIATKLKDRLSKKGGRERVEEDGDSTFEEIQRKLATYATKPNPTEERDLLLIRDSMVDAAESAGVFDSIKEKINGKIFPDPNSNFDEKYKDVSKINTASLESEARGVGAMKIDEAVFEAREWKDEFKGIIDAYKQNVLLNMRIAKEKALVTEERGNKNLVKRLERAQELMVWGSPPAKLERMAREHVASKQPDKGGETAGEDVASAVKEGFQEALGIQSKEKQLDDFRAAEADMQKLQIQVGNEPKFWTILTEAQKNEWYARVALSSACFNKKMGGDEMMENPDLKGGVNKEAMKNLFSKKGVMEALSLYTIFITDIGFIYGKEHAREHTYRGRNIEGQSIGDVLFQGVDVDDEAKEKVPKNFNNIYSQWEIDSLKGAMQEWLKSNRGLDDTEAKDAEQIAWNLMYVSGMIEHFDSSDIRESAKRVIPVSGLKSYPMWATMNPNDRLISSALRMEAKGSFGPWMLNRKGKKVGLSADPNDIKKWEPEKKDRLPNTMFRNAFDYIGVGEKENYKDEGGNTVSITPVINEGGEKLVLSDLLLKNGYSLIDNPGAEVVNIDYKSLHGAPFLDYYNDTVASAGVILSVIGGKGRDVSYQELSNACRKLGINGRRQREVLLLAKDGVNSRKLNLESKRGKGYWQGYLEGVVLSDPLFFQ